MTDVPPPPAYGQPQDGAPAGWGDPKAREVRPRTLGLVAMLLSLAVIVLSVLASAIVGAGFGRYATTGDAGFSFDTGDLTPAQAAAVAPIGVLMGVQILLGTLFGILAIVLGIIAVATRRGRASGVVAIVVAALAPVLSVVVYVAALAITAAAT